MLQLMVYSILMISSLIFLQMNHPLAMGLMLLIQTLLICMITGLMAKSFWFSYILFLIFLGGMLVLFIYVTSLASNEMFSFSTKMTINYSIMMIIFSIIIINIDKSKFLLMFMNQEMESIINMNSYITENSLTLNKLYNYPTNLTTILLMNYLLITLIASVKITNLFFGPLRPMS